jgi:hypothetical protein
VTVERTIVYIDRYTPEEYEKLKADEAEGLRKYMEIR